MYSSSTQLYNDLLLYPYTQITQHQNPASRHADHDSEDIDIAKEGEYIAVVSNKYDDRPLLGRVTGVKQDKVIIDWMVGSYSGTWREWRGRSGGKAVIYSDTIMKQDIVLRNITLTKSHRLKPEQVTCLKELYSKF